MILEGNPHPGNRLTGTDGVPPQFCPVCGSDNFSAWGWGDDGSYWYPYMVCYGKKPRLLIWLYQKMSLVSPSGAHYAYMLPKCKINPRRANLERFDRHTGRPR